MPKFYENEEVFWFILCPLFLGRLPLEKEPKLEISEFDPYCICDSESNEIIAVVTSSPNSGNKDVRGDFFVQLFALAYELFAELETIVQAKKKGMLNFWSDKRAKMLINKIRGGK